MKAEQILMCFVFSLLVSSVAVSAEDMVIAPISAGTSIDSVILATTSNYPDTLVAGVAAEKIGAPLLLTEPDALSSETKAEIESLGVSTIYVIGGPAVIAESVEDELGESYTVVRIWGMTRYGTAVKVAEYFWEDSEKAVLVWDNLARPEEGNSEMISQAKEIASEEGAPLLLINKNFIPDTVAGALMNLTVQSVVLIGNVGSEVTSSLEELGISVSEAIAGSTPEQTRERLKEKLKQRIRTRVKNQGKMPLVVVAFGNWSDTMKAPYMPNGTSRHISSEGQIDDLIDEIKDMNYSRIYVVGKPDLARVIYSRLTDAGINVTHVSGNVVEVVRRMAQHEKEVIRRLSQAARDSLSRLYSLKVSRMNLESVSGKLIERIEATIAKVPSINSTRITSNLERIRSDMLEKLEDEDYQGAWLMYQRLESQEGQIILRYKNLLTNRYSTLTNVETKVMTLAEKLKAARAATSAANGAD